MLSPVKERRRVSVEERPESPMTKPRSRWRRTVDFVEAHRFQLYLGLGFLLIAGVTVADYTPPFVADGVWPWVFGGTGLLILATMVLPFSSPWNAAAGATVSVVAMARGAAAFEVYVRQDVESALVATVLWGVVALVGLSWSRLTFASQMRRVVDEGRERRG